MWQLPLITTRRHEYGATSIKFNFVADDGAYLDPENKDLLKQYVVTAQDVAPNSEMKLTYRKDSKGNFFRLPHFRR